MQETVFWDAAKLWLALVEKTWGSLHWSKPDSFIDDAIVDSFHDGIDLVTIWRGNGSHAHYTLGGGKDLFVGTDGDEVVLGLTGNDVINGEKGNDLLDGGIGDDILNGGEGHDLLLAGLGDDLLEGGAGNDRLFGDEGDDTLTGGQGYDILDGEAGINTYLASREGGWMTPGEIINLGTGYVRDTFGQVDRLLNIQNASGNLANDTIYGSSAANILEGGYGDDVIHGGDGNDTIYGEARLPGIVGFFDFSDRGFDTVNGNDGDDHLSGYRMNGGAGADTFHFGNQQIRFVEDFESGVDTLDLTFYANAMQLGSSTRPLLVTNDMSALIEAGTESGGDLFLKVIWIDWYGDVKENMIILEGTTKADVSASDFTI
jgi:Ca2+-binding RTX toxin-like protein